MMPRPSTYRVDTVGYCPVQKDTVEIEAIVTEVPILGRDEYGRRADMAYCEYAETNECPQEHTCPLAQNLTIL